MQEIQNMKEEQNQSTQIAVIITKLDAINDRIADIRTAMSELSNRYVDVVTFSTLKSTVTEMREESKWTRRSIAFVFIGLVITTLWGLIINQK